MLRLRLGHALAAQATFLLTFYHLARFDDRV